MRLLELTILSDNLSETEKFYSETLGLEILQRNKLKMTFKAGCTKLTFQKSENEKPIYHLAFNIPNNQLNEALEWIDEKIGIIEPNDSKRYVDFDDWEARSIYFWDNNGNILEFIARFGLNNRSDKPFDGSQILCVSEIGVPVDNVSAQCSKLQNKFGLNFFDRQLPADNFAALGNDEGLIIIVKDGRIWFPTDKESGKYRTKIKVEHNDHIHELEFNAKKK